MEEFRDIPGYEGLYQVSNEGRVKTLGRVIMRSNGKKLTVKERIMKPACDKYGYLVTKLSHKGKSKTVKVHKLVAMVFLGHIPCGYEEVVDHINNVCTDNRVENLQLISQRENSSKDRNVGTSKYVGVYWYTSRSEWRSKIRINNKTVHLGTHKYEYKAHLKYQKALNNIDKYENPKQFRKYLELC